ncbi:unnamed protein product, partial [Allacma fusca]
DLWMFLLGAATKAGGVPPTSLNSRGIPAVFYNYSLSQICQDIESRF